MNIIIERTIELNAPLLTEPLPGSLFTTENKAHQFLIGCTQNGLPITLSGTVSAKFIREANNTTILMSGSISGGKASLILPADCYNISGRFDLTIFVTSNNVTTCVYSATGSVKAAQDGTLVDEGTVVPSIEQLQQDVTNLQNGKVDRAGDTMTGPLNLRSATVFSTGDGYARLYFKDTASGANLAAFNLLISNRRLFATEYSSGSSNVERFYFPAPDANRTADGNYEIVTTKGSYTMTGTLTSPRLNTLSTSFPAIWYMTDGNTDIGYHGVRVSDRRFVIAYRNGAGVNQQFSLPPLSDDTSESTWYDILTTKDWITPVSVTTGVSRVTVQYNNSFKFLSKLVVVNARLSIATGTAIAVNSGVCNVQQAAYVPASPGDTGTFATISAAPYGPFKISPNGTVTATVQIPADYSGTITMSGVFFAA